MNKYVNRPNKRYTIIIIKLTIIISFMHTNICMKAKTNNTILWQDYSINKIPGYPLEYLADGNLVVLNLLNPMTSICHQCNNQSIKLPNCLSQVKAGFVPGVPA